MLYNLRLLGTRSEVSCRTMLHRGCECLAPLSVNGLEDKAHVVLPRTKKLSGLACSDTKLLIVFIMVRFLLANKQTVTEFTTLEEEGNATDLESAPTTTPANLHISSIVTPKGIIDCLEQESSGDSTRESTIEDGPKKFRSLAEIYANTLEEELDPNELVLLAVKKSTTYCEAAIETMWQEVM